MIRARHGKFFVIFFDLYTNWMLKKHFHRITIKDIITHADNPVLMIGNHFSWWDGFIAHYINLKVFRKKIHIMMLEDELRSRMFLSKAGAYSIRKNNRSSIESLEYTADLLDNAGHLVVLYPQGAFQSVHSRKISFQPGIMHIIKSLKRPVQIVFYAALTDYFSSRKPCLTIYLRTVEPKEFQDMQDLESAYIEFYSISANQQNPG